MARSMRALVTALCAGVATAVTVAFAAAASQFGYQRADVYLGSIWTFTLSIITSLLTLGRFVQGKMQQARRE